MKTFSEMFMNNIRQFGMLITLVALVAFFQIKTGGLVLTSANMINLLNGNAYILVLAIGMALVIISGHIDLSVGSVAALTGILAAISIRDWGFSAAEGTACCLAVGALIGAWQGFWIAYVGIPSFVATLAGMMLFRGANQFIGKSNTIAVPEEIRYIGGGYLPAIGPDTGLNNLTLLLGGAAILWLIGNTLLSRRATLRYGGNTSAWVWDVACLAGLSGVIAFMTYLFASGRPGTSFPTPGLILLGLTLCYGFIAKQTIFGRHVYAVGGALHAARLSGVNSRQVVFLVMMNMSVLAALAGLMFVGRATASGPFDGINWELDAISAVFIGGAAVSGGVGTVVGSVVGGLVMAVLNNGLQLMGIGADMTQVIKGFVLILAVGFDVYNKTEGRPSLIAMLLRIARSADESAPSPGKKPALSPVVVATGAALVGVVTLAITLYHFNREVGVAHHGTMPPKADLVGVALPQKTSENWVLAELAFRDGLARAGRRFDVQFANAGVAEQQNQILSMIAKGAKYLVVGAIDGAQLGTQLKEAKNAGVVVIAYDRPLTNTGDVDFYVSYDNHRVGALQGEALLEGLRKRKGDPPWTVELIAGSPDDANSKVFFDGAMSLLVPLVNNGAVLVKSGQTSFAQASTPGWKAENAQRRMDTILAGVYAKDNLDGVLSPNDTLARATITAVRAAGKDLPVITGQDFEVESVKSILKGEQYATIKKDTLALVQQTIELIDALDKGAPPPVNDSETCRNGVKVVPACLLEPEIVTLENALTKHANDSIIKSIIK